MGGFPKCQTEAASLGKYMPFEIRQLGSRMRNREETMPTWSG